MGRMLETPKRRPARSAKALGAERAVPDPVPGDPPFAIRKKYWFDCVHCAQSWECCGICHRGALFQGTTWGDPDVNKIECKGGCGGHRIYSEMEFPFAGTRQPTGDECCTLGTS
jgi:hypothetical protein